MTHKEKLKRKYIEQGKKEVLKFFCKMIDKDIAYQKKQLTGNYEKDKAIKWRIIGFEELKKQLKSQST